MNKIVNRWTDSIKGKNTSELGYKDRLKEHKIVDFTLSKTEFTALGNTSLFTSSYEKIKRIGRWKPFWNGNTKKRNQD